MGQVQDGHLYIHVHVRYGSSSTVNKQINAKGLQTTSFTILLLITIQKQTMGDPAKCYTVLEFKTSRDHFKPCIVKNRLSKWKPRSKDLNNILVEKETRPTANGWI